MHYYYEIPSRAVIVEFIGAQDKSSGDGQQADDLDCRLRKLTV